MYGIPTEPTQPGLSRVRGVEGGQGRRTVEAERQKMGFATWSEAVAAASDKTVSRRQVNSPILPEES